MNKKIFGEYLRKLRKDRNYSLNELAEQAGLTPYYLSYIENGIKTNPSKKIIAGLFKALKMSKVEIEIFFDLHAKANGCASYDIIPYIMANDDIRKNLRNERDKSETSPNWNEFLDNFMKYNE